MPTIDQYKLKLQRATEAGDDAAVQYFQSQINKGMEMQSKGSILSPLAQGATLGFSDEIAGGAAGLTEMLKGGSFSEGYDPVVQDFRESAKAYGERNPITSTVAEIGGGLALPFGAIKSVGTGLKAALASGAGYGAGTAEGGLEERLKGAGVGAAAGASGYGLLKGAGKLGRGLFNKGQPASRKASFRKDAELLKQNGIRVSPGENLANQNLRQSEESFGKVFSGPDNRPDTLYRKLMKHASGPTYGFKPQDVADGDLSVRAVEKAKQRYGKAYDGIFENTSMNPNQWWKEFLPAEQRFDELMGWEQGTARAIVDGFRDQISKMTTITGRDYQRLRSKLGDKAFKAGNNPQMQGLREVYRDMRKALDDGFRKTLSNKQAKKLDEVNKSYGAFKELSKAAENPQAIGTFVNNVRRNRTRLPKGFSELAEAYQNVLLRGYPKSSGTAENLTFGDIKRTALHGARMLPGRASQAYENVRRNVVPAPGQRAPGRRAAGAAVQKRVDPILQALQGATPFIAGQQSQDTPLGAVPANLIGASR